MGILIEEVWINRTEGYRNGESGVYETRFEKPAEVYRYGLKEYGRCGGRMYVDENGRSKHIGWVFEKIAKYEDTGKPYKLETWIALHEKKPVTTKQEFLLEIK